MKLIEFSHKAGDWEINNLHLGDVNLIVGENAVGKSRTLTAIKIFYKDDNIFNNGHFNDGFWNFTFLDENSFTLEFTFTIKDSKILNEEISVNDDSKLKRNEHSSEIKSAKKDKFQKITPPENKLIIEIRRDIEEYPFIEKINNWIAGLCTFDFSSFNPILHRVHNKVPAYYKNLKETHRNRIIENFNSLGYSVENIEIVELNDFVGKYYALKIKEKDIKNSLNNNLLSQGMYRSLYLIIFLEHLVSINDRTTLFVDDLGEGLDYQKATNLGKYVFERCKEAGIQLIATSNDNFLMDVVDLDHWNILTRKGSKVLSINKTTHPKIFEDFMFTGLSNFDLLTSDYLTRKLKEYDTV